MREIKFRIYDMVNKEMVSRPWMFIEIDDGTIWFNKGGVYDSLESKNPDIYKVMQFTGLKDKNGREIFEGDILKKTGPDWSQHKDDSPDDYEPPIIELERDVATMERFPRYWLKNESFGYEGDDLQNPEEWEIIGNIYESRELLTEVTPT